MGKFLKIVFISFLTSLLILVFGGIYIYKVHVFKTMNICVGGDVINTLNPCSGDAECVDNFIYEQNETMNSSPEFMKNKFLEAFNEAAYCDNNCMEKEIYGLGEFDVECKEGDKKIVIEFRGKDAIQILKIVANNPEMKEEFKSELKDKF